MKLEIVYCVRCRCTHPPGEHKEGKRGKIAGDLPGKPKEPRAAEAPRVAQRGGKKRSNLGREVEAAKLTAVLKGSLTPRASAELELARLKALHAARMKRWRAKKVKRNP